MSDTRDAHKWGRPARLVTFVLQALSAIEIFVILIIVVFGGAAQAGAPILPYELVPAYDALRQSLYITPWLLLALLMTWTYMVSKVTHELSTETLENSPTLSAFFYIIPILSLWKPWEVVRELYQANRSPTDWKGSGKAGIVAWWWWFRILSNVGGMMMSFAMKSADPDTTAYVGVSLGLLTLALVALCLQFLIVRRIHTWQTTALRRPAVAEVF